MDLASKLIIGFVTVAVASVVTMAGFGINYLSKKAVVNQPMPTAHTIEIVQDEEVLEQVDMNKERVKQSIEQYTENDKPPEVEYNEESMDLIKKYTKESAQKRYEAGNYKGFFEKVYMMDEGEKQAYYKSLIPPGVLEAMEKAECEITYLDSINYVQKIKNKDGSVKEVDLEATGGGNISGGYRFSRDIQTGDVYNESIEVEVGSGDALLHEVGHFVQSGMNRKYSSVILSDQWRYIAECEVFGAPVTDYEKSSFAEYFAGAFCVYCTEPKTLAKKCPMTYMFIAKAIADNFPEGQAK